MAFQVTRNQEWLDRASDSRYPLISGTTARDLTGTFELPNDFLVSVYLAVPIDLQISPISVWISRITISPHFVQLVFSASVDDTDQVIARANVSLAAAQAQINDPKMGYSHALLEGVSPFSDLRGQVMVARLENLAKQPVGVFDFDYQATALDPDCIRPHIRQVPAIEAELATDQYARLTGTVRLRAGANMRLRVVTENNEPVIYLDALDPTDLNDKLECDDSELTKPIYRINGIPGDAQGNYQLVSSRCMEITPASFGAALRNTCSEPCAGCTEVEPLASRVKAMENQLPALSNFVANLNVALQRMLICTEFSTAVTECQTLGGNAPEAP